MLFKNESECQNPIFQREEDLLKERKKKMWLEMHIGKDGEEDDAAGDANRRWRCRPEKVMVGKFQHGGGWWL
ncbi:hypothetical protein L6452_39168 [Arctium lappa]|uniref:Uncharacterized protein n=1 Tax=Arctium lappa TaxID=4217 RepID=A0ACB8XSQ6_ARCLA|nr:hypothetical protein L6452_39168 [Arctium lappa]